jgi:hypothetical protein
MCRELYREPFCVACWRVGGSAKRKDPDILTPGMWVLP